jgi:hypothetical protein
LKPIFCVFFCFVWGERGSGGARAGTGKKKAAEKKDKGAHTRKTPNRSLCLLPDDVVVGLFKSKSNRKTESKRRRRR